MDEQQHDVSGSIGVSAMGERTRRAAMDNEWTSRSTSSSSGVKQWASSSMRAADGGRSSLRHHHARVA